MDAHDEGLQARWFASGLPEAVEIIVPYPVESEASGVLLFLCVGRGEVGLVDD